LPGGGPVSAALPGGGPVSAALPGGGPVPAALPAGAGDAGSAAAGRIAAGRGAQAAVLRGTLGFVAGFTLVFTALGAAASGIGQLLGTHQRTLSMVAGAVVVLLGLWLAGVGTPALFQRERRFHPLPSRLGTWAPPVMGMAFAFGWTPCIGPVLGGVLGLASTRSTLGDGVLLLVVYSLGLGVPFVVTGLAFHRLAGLLARVRRRAALVNLVAGAALVVFGLLLVTDQLPLLSAQVSSWLSHIGLGRLTTS
jgi:cytochrome c-type biogenesis protein